MSKKLLLLGLSVQVVLNAAITDKDFKLLDGKGIILNDPSNIYSTTIKSPEDLNNNITLTLPSTPPQNGQILAVDNFGKLSWIDNNTTTTSKTATQKIDKFILDGNKIKLSLLSDGEADKEIDLSSVTAFLKNRDILDTLSSIDKTKALSANQGRELKKLVDALNHTISTINTSSKELETKITSTAAFATTHALSKTNPHQVTKTQVGLSHVDNTSDADKPISIKTQTALDTKADKTNLANINQLLSQQISEVNQSMSDNQGIDLLDFNGTHLTMSLENDDTNKTIKLDRNLSSLKDINVTSLADGQVLRYDANNATWKAYTLPAGTTIVDNLNTAETSQALSANQGKVLDKKIGDLNSTITSNQSNIDGKISEINSTINSKKSVFNTKIADLNSTIKTNHDATNAKIYELNSSVKIALASKANNSVLTLVSTLQTNLANINQLLSQQISEVNQSMSDNQGIDLLDFNGTHLTMSLENDDTNKTIKLDRNLSSLKDINVTSLADGQVLRYDANSSQWLAKALPTTRIDGLDSKITDLNNSLRSTITSNQDNTNQKIVDLNKTIKDNKTRLDKNITDVNTQISANKTATNSKITDLNNTIKSNERNISSIFTTITAKALLTATNKTSINDLNSTIKMNKLDVTAIQTNVLELNNSIKTNTTDIATIKTNISNVNDSMSEYNQTIKILAFDGSALKISLSNNDINKTIILDRNISSLGDVDINLENLKDGQVLEYNLTAKMWIPASTKSVANFTPITVPTTPVIGDIYLDDSDNMLKAFDGSKWHNLWNDEKVFKNKKPSSPVAGDVFIDKVDENHSILKAYDGEEWYILGANSNAAYIQPITQGELTELINENKPITRSALLALISTKENVTDVNTSLITDMSDLFKGYKNFNQDISKWDVSNVTTMSHMFDGAEGFNKNISDWNVSEVLDMSYMFKGAKSFNQDISSWDISNVTNMSHMFDEAIAFNKPLPWTVTNVTNMESMFQNATAFNQNITNWDVSNVTNMKNMLDGAEAFNQDIHTWNVNNVADSESFSDASDTTIQKPNFPLSKAKLMEMIEGNIDVTSVDISKITDMSNLFKNKSDFNQDISNWNVSNVTNMSKMFKGLTAFNQNISDWNVSKVTDMSDMFNGATAFNQNISTWKVLNVTNMSGMFNGATAFNQDISSWDVFKVLDMGHMFDGATAFNQDIHTWNVSNVSKMNYMFNGATVFNYDISTWNVSKVATMDYMFKGATVFDQNISSWNVNKVSMRNNFAENSLIASKRPKFPLTLVELKAMIANGDDVTQVNTSLITDMSSLFNGKTTFNQDISKWDVSNVITMRLMFFNADAFNQDISGWNVSNVTNMYEMFDDAGAFNQDISGWNVSNVTNMYAMFWKANHFNQDLSGWNVPKVYISDSFSNVADYTAAKPKFHLSKKELIAKITAKEDITNVDISAISDMSGLFNSNRTFIGLGSIEDWNVSHVTNMSYMFNLVTGFNQDISKWDVSNVTDMNHMFNGATKFNQDISSWDVSNVTDMNHIFSSATVFNQPLNSWNVSNVTDMSFMFYPSVAFNQPLNSWDVSSVTTMLDMFAEAKVFNQPLNNWDTSHVTDMHGLFWHAYLFNQDISNWNVRTVTRHDAFSTSSNLLPENKPTW